jgi:uncharacterized alkaline shock family protein YloU
MDIKDESQMGNTGKQGTIKISEEVVATIAGLAAAEVAGIAGMSGGIAGDLVEKFGRKNLAKGIKVEVGEKEANIDINVIVDYGVDIHEVAIQLQNSVRNAVEKMTGLEVVNVNVHIQGLSFSTENKEEDGRSK